MSKLPEKLINLIELLKQTKMEEIDCDEFWDNAAKLAEADLELDLDELKLYLHHLALCPGCAEEFALLKEVISDSEQTEEMK